ncbi:similar to Saccharomyces cerevisiae YOL145C CTR9 Component of the Paf1p complex [Maudiozyma barnettii]|uniref:Similar to Saccharomyces cerevisiae YOL145C CTR9 Component of the Paf1p complex n=1 Tax=Maudiozyma barnettii TaxID=61262 RepID=A0A8H2VDM9_9SACH|nr:Ctr9p [Kazachstania barnettii]CAB4253490.1 similar to Saccharomyces cerevisiae YOL145C CTR9 Component of the Paf1p complex [Kazachstania barnettii]CAD1781164.1 similar to Saccharomyces cerevisiae YOL145C CTR9 Component of the Paf1p complex [Kazachstania barnettii]
MSSPTKDASVIDLANYPSMDWPTSLDIPLKASEELVSIDLDTDLPDDPNDLRTLLVEENSDKEHWLMIAIAYCNHGMLEGGIKLIQIALDIFSDYDKASLYTFLTWAYLKMAKMNNIDVAKREEALQNAENNLKDAIAFNPTWIANILATLDLYYQRGHYEKALETADLFIKGIEAEERRSGKPLKPNSMFLFLRAKLLYHNKNYKASLKSFQELLVINPMIKPDPRIGIGMCFWQLKDHQMAIKSWKRAAQLDPNNKGPSTLVLLTEFYKALTESNNDTQFEENFTSALKDLDSQLSADKENPVLLILLQSYYYFKGNYTKILEIYENKLAPRKELLSNTVLSDATFWCGRAQYALGEYRKAFAMFQESLRKNEENLLAKFGIGQAQIKTNLIEESILTFENLLKTHESIQELNYILGLLYSSKCLDSNSRKSLSAKALKSTSNKAIQFLEKYVNLTTAKKNQLVTPRAYLLLSQLYEIRNHYKQSLELLSKVVDELTFINEDSVPLEIYNNMGCFYFINGEVEAANKYFKSAQELNHDKSVAITIDFNVARSDECTNIEASEAVYGNILQEHPSYLSAKIRELYCKYISSTTHNIEKEDDIMKALLSKNESNLEIRSFYSWYLNTVHNSSDLATESNKETLVKYDSHDLYALVSLANLYCAIAKESKKTGSSKDMEKSKQSYLKAIQLYQKVLQIDPLNIFAAQGIAIVFAENKRMGPALEVLRKVRDSIKNEDIHINLANCLLEMNEYVKSIEIYELLIRTFSNLKNKPYIYNMLGKAWYFRGMREKSVEYLKKSKESVKSSIETQGDEALVEGNEKEINKSNKYINTLKYNLALLEFQIAETLRRASGTNRTSADLKEALVGLQNGLVLLQELKDDESFVIVSKEELEQRIQLGETTMKTSLQRCISEQEVFDKQNDVKLEDARKALEQQELESRRRQEKEDEEKRIKLEKQADEYKKLQDEAQQYMLERESMLVDENNAGADSDASYDSDGQKKKRKRSKSSKEPSSDKKRKHTSGSGNDNDDDDDDDVIKPSKTKHRGKKSTLSDEFIADSDESGEEPVYDEGSDKEDTKNNDDGSDDGDLF